MKVAKLTDVKNELSRYVEHVRRGGTVRILLRGVPVADIVPLGAAHGPDDDWTEAEIADLERRGIIRRGGRRRASELDRPGPRVRDDAGVEALLRERRDGR